MRKIIDVSVFGSDKNLLLWFMSLSCPEGFYYPQGNYDEDYDISFGEFIEENYDIDFDAVEVFTQYYDGVIDENDGIIDDPNAVEICSYNGKPLYVEFHPGDILYMLGDDEDDFGSLGPHYEIRKIPFDEFEKLAADLNDTEKLLLLPMAAIEQEQKKAFLDIVRPVIQKTGVEEEHIDAVCGFYMTNCSGGEEPD